MPLDLDGILDVTGYLRENHLKIENRQDMEALRSLVEEELLPGEVLEFAGGKAGSYATINTKGRTTAMAIISVLPGEAERV